MTYPLQATTECETRDAESSRPWARSLIVRWACPVRATTRAKASLDEYLRRWRCRRSPRSTTRALLGTCGLMERCEPSDARVEKRPSPAASRSWPTPARRVTPIASRTSWLKPPARCARMAEGLPPELRHEQRATGPGFRSRSSITASRPTSCARCASAVVGSSCCRTPLVVRCRSDWRRRLSSRTAPVTRPC